MNADQLLSRLDRVKQIGTDKWIARCPAHDDKSPSLSIRELEDGRVLAYCFAGCGIADVMSAISLSLSDLYPDNLSDHMPRVRDRKHWHAAKEALKALSDDALIVAIAAENVAEGISLSDEDRTLLTETAVRIRQARKAVML